MSANEKRHVPLDGSPPASESEAGALGEPEASDEDGLAGDDLETRFELAQAEIERLQDQLLRRQAELINFRRRVQRERAEQRGLAQVELLEYIRAGIPGDKWMFANAGRDFPEGSPFPDLFNGYLLENALGDPARQGFGLETVDEILASAERALATTREPHWVVFAVDTDNTGLIDRRRLRVGFAASLLMDNTFFAYDHGSEDHGDVIGWWFHDYYTANLGDPEAGYSLEDGVYRRRFENGEIVIAASEPVQVSFPSTHRKIGSLEVSTEFTVPANDAGVFERVESGAQP